jgi:hypothetical protein
MNREEAKININYLENHVIKSVEDRIDEIYNELDNDTKWKKRAIEQGYIISSELTKEYNDRLIAVARLRDLDNGNLTKECPLFIADNEKEVVKKAFEWIIHKQLGNESLEVWRETEINIEDY